MGNGWTGEEMSESTRGRCVLGNIVFKKVNQGPLGGSVD